MDLPEQRVVVHRRIRERHPDVTEDDVRTAWDGQIKRRNAKSCILPNTPP